MHPLLQQHQHSLLGRLRTKILTTITGNSECLPSARELWRVHMAEWKQNPNGARINFHLLHVDEASEVLFPTALSRQQVRASLRHVAKHEAPLRKYVEGEIHASKGSQKVGCLLLGHKRQTGGPGYYAAILTEEAFPSCGYVSIVPADVDGPGMISELRHDGWHNLSAVQAGHQSSSLIALTALNDIPNSDGRVRMRVDDLSMRPEDEPPCDAECMRRLNLVMRGRMALTKAVVSVNSVRLFDLPFSKSLQPEITSAIAHVLPENQNALLVYWDGSHFVSSDDYYVFLAYELLSAKELPVVIMGNFPAEVGRIEQRGNQELLPPPFVLRNKVMPGMTKELASWQTEQKTLQAKRLPPPTDLMATWITFAEMLTEDEVNERKLHEFLNDNPIMMGAHWDSVQPEVRFGNQYRADFILRAIRAMPKVQLVELERSNHKLFTKDLHETDEVTHAVQQVSDWLRWWRQNSDNPIVAPSRGVDPSGIVVIGRSSHLTDRERETLAHNNQRREIEVITYDELLDDFGSLILHRLDNTRT